MTAILRAARDPQRPVMPITVWTQLREEAKIAGMRERCNHCAIAVGNDYPRRVELQAAFDRLVDCDLLEYIAGVGYVTTAGGILALAARLEEER